MTAFIDTEEFPPPADLTSLLVKADDQYWSGGAYGDVYRCWYHGADVPEQVAVKAFRFRLMGENVDSDKHQKMIRRELGLWRRLKHNNIVPFLGIAYGYGMQDAVSLVSLWMPNGTLASFLKEHDELGEAHRLQLLLDIANGLHYLHSFPIIHGDLYCNNVLIDTDHTARLVDFGYASLLGDIPDAVSYLQRSTIEPGALRWTAPEQLIPKDGFELTIKSDIYSFGCIGLFVLSGKQPWSDIKEYGCVVVNISQGRTPARPEFRAIDDHHWKLIERCWSSPQERPLAKELITSIERFLLPQKTTMDGSSLGGLGDRTVDNQELFDGDDQTRSTLEQSQRIIPSCGMWNQSGVGGDVCGDAAELFGEEERGVSRNNSIHPNGSTREQSGIGRDDVLGEAVNLAQSHAYATTERPSESQGLYMSQDAGGSDRWAELPTTSSCDYSAQGFPSFLNYRLSASPHPARAHIQHTPNAIQPFTNSLNFSHDQNYHSSVAPASDYLFTPSKHESAMDNRTPKSPREQWELLQTSWSVSDTTSFNRYFIDPSEILCRWSSCGDRVEIKDIKSHLVLKHGVEFNTHSYKCLWDTCSRAQLRGLNLVRHIREAHGCHKRWTCPTCDKSFSRCDSLRRHLENCVGRGATRTKDISERYNRLCRL